MLAYWIFIIFVTQFLYVDLYISNGNYIELHLYPTYGYQHRVIQKIK